MHKTITLEKSKLLLILLCAVLVVVLGVMLWLRLKPAANAASAVGVGTGGFFDGNAVEGYLPTKTREEIQDELNRIVEEGMFNISIAPVISFADGEAQGQARIENIAANHYHMSVSITRDDNGEVIYESKGIAPGAYIEYITLSEDLPEGQYNVTATFTAYDTDTLESVGKAAAKITVIVES